MSSLLNHIYPKGYQSYSHLSGGDINEVIHVKLIDENDHVIKINSAQNFPKMLQIEAKSLQFLSNYDVNTPKSIKNGEFENQQFLVLEYIASAQKSSSFWSDFGIEMAKLHSKTQPEFGFEFNNYIGSLYQSNTSHTNWTEFFVNERCIPQVKMAVDAGFLNKAELNSFDRFYKEVDSIWPNENPALLHGDLWSGNYMVDSKGNPMLIDPAIYFGHREMDIGMMHLFGGFHADLFEKYNEIYPMQPGWQDRIMFNQLYYLLVHLNLFGLGYKSQVLNCISGF